MTRLQIWLMSILATIVATAGFWGVWSAFAGGIPVQEVVLWKIGAEGQEVTTSINIYRAFDILAFGIFPFFGLPLLWYARRQVSIEKLVVGLVFGLVVGLGFGLGFGLVVGLVGGLGFGLVVGLVGGLGYWLSFATVIAVAFGGPIGGAVLLPPFLLTLCVYGGMMVWRNHISQPRLSLSKSEAA